MGVSQVFGRGTYHHPLVGAVLIDILEVPKITRQSMKSAGSEQSYLLSAPVGETSCCPQHLLEAHGSSLSDKDCLPMAFDVRLQTFIRKLETSFKFLQQRE